MGERVLVVGSGGLGCELVKNLAQDASNSITLVDDDTIDATNLNRQFLFVAEDVGQSKCEIVAKKIGKMMNTQIKFFFGKIDKFCHLDFYRQFDVVYNCLDNNEARSFVNQRCYLSGSLLIDGGSGGWLGQSFVNAGECFDCLPKAQEKVYPVCTIRQKPKSFEHCLVWAKSVVSNKDIKALQEELEQRDVCLNIENETDSLVLDKSVDAFSIKENTIESSIRIKKESIKVENENIIENNIYVKMNNAVKKKYKVNNELESTIHSYDMRINSLHKNPMHANSNEDESALIHEIACIKSKRFGIAPFSFIDSQTFVQKIIPSICTTNAIVASLMILSRKNRKNYFLVQGSLNVLETSLNPKRPDCLTCSLPTYQCKYISGSKIPEFLVLFKSDTLFDENTFFNRHSEDALDLLEGKIMLTSKNGFSYRVYFLKGDNFEVKRIK